MYRSMLELQEISVNKYIVICWLSVMEIQFNTSNCIIWALQGSEKISTKSAHKLLNLSVRCVRLGRNDDTQMRSFLECYESGYERNPWLWSKLLHAKHTHILEIIKQHSLNGSLEFCCEENGSVWSKLWSWEM